MRGGKAPWNDLFSVDCHVTSSREWPVPDFVLYDNTRNLSVAAEFKPPGQSKREYLTGLGQAVSYTRGFDYGMLIVPDIADDGYPIAEYIRSVLELHEYAGAPICLLRYDPAQITADHAGSDIIRFFAERHEHPPQRAGIGAAFYAKWREISPEEMSCFLRKLYDEVISPTGDEGTKRDRAWAQVWQEVQAGHLHHWGGGVRHVADTRASYTAWMKNWRNFMNHVGWMETDGSLTQAGLTAMHTAILYGPDSQLFLGVIAKALLGTGKHLILINAINEFQDEYLSSTGPFANEAEWLSLIEDRLEDTGLLKRNPARHEAAVRASSRQFLKAEKQLWRQLQLIVPNGARVYHRGRGFVFDWARITQLVGE
ncbi:MAG: hypothetical protein JW990_05335 [Thermoleophilia bacterium]|nr:hypothetical protein [Thermoleophilia bacterium]